MQSSKLSPLPVWSCPCLSTPMLSRFPPLSCSNLHDFHTRCWPFQQPMWQPNFRGEGTWHPEPLSRAMHPRHQGVVAPDQCGSLQVQVEQEVGQSAMPLLLPIAMWCMAMMAPEQACASRICVMRALGAVLKGEAFILLLLPAWAQAKQAVACILQVLGDGLKAAPGPGQLRKEVAGAAQVAAALRLSQGLEHGDMLPFCAAQAAAGAEVGLREAVRRGCLLGQALHSAVRQKHPSTQLRLGGSCSAPGAEQGQHACMTDSQTGTRGSIHEEQ